MPNVLHLFNIFGALTEKALLDYTLGLRERGCDLTIGHETLAEEAPATGLRLVNLRRICVDPTDDVARQMEAIARNVGDPALHSLLDEDFAVVHGHFGPRLLQAAAWTVRKTPIVISLYGYDVGRLLCDPCWIERYRWAADHSVTFVALAQYMLDRLVELGLPRDRLALIRLGINIQEHRYDPHPAPRSPRFVFIGRFVPKKAPDDLLAAVASLVHEHGLPASLDLIGSGPMEDELRQRVLDLKLADHVRFVGRVPFTELFTWLHDSTALVQPSVVAPDGDSEGAPMVLMHAQAVAIPCITTRHSGNPEVLPPEGQSFVVPEHDPAALAQAMHRMIEMDDAGRRLLQDAGRAWIEKQYSLEQTVTSYDALYRRLLRGDGDNANVP